MSKFEQMIDNKYSGLKDVEYVDFISEKDKRDEILSTYSESLDEVFETLELFDGMTVSFHHHLRNGDYVLNMVMDKIAKLGYRDITISASSIFPCHEPLVDLIKDGVVTNIYAAYMSGPVARCVSEGHLEGMCVMHSHGYRSTMQEKEEVVIDFAFLAVPTASKDGNCTGSEGPSSCGVLGYAISDSQCAKEVIVITDNIAEPKDIEIPAKYVDYVVKVDKIGNPAGIVSGTTQLTRDPVGLRIAKETAKFMYETGDLKDGYSFQTGAGGISLAVAKEVRDLQHEHKIKGSFASGGITDYLVNMLNEDLFEELYDVQCFELGAVKSISSNPKHHKMSASKYANILNRDNIVDKLDFVILGATEIDLNYNVNVTTTSDGYIMGGSGGHADTAAGAKYSIIVSKLVSSRISVVVDEVTTITTPGDSVDVLVTDRGIAINPKHEELIKTLKAKGNLNICTIEELYEKAIKLTGTPRKIENNNRVVAISQYRDGTCLDVVRSVK